LDYIKDLAKKKLYATKHHKIYNYNYSHVSYQYNNEIGFICVKEEDTGYFTSDNEPGGIENATRNTFAKLT
jgi:hypothetical protein